MGGQAHPHGGYFGIWDPLWGTCLRLGPGMLSPGGFVPAATQHPCGTLPRNVPPLHPHSYPHCGAPRRPVLVLDLNAQNENRDIAADSLSSSLTFPKALEGRQICFVFWCFYFACRAKPKKTIARHLLPPPDPQPIEIIGRLKTDEVAWGNTGPWGEREKGRRRRGRAGRAFGKRILNRPTFVVDQTSPNPQLPFSAKPPLLLGGTGRLKTGEVAGGRGGIRHGHRGRGENWEAGESSGRDGLKFWASNWAGN